MFAVKPSIYEFQNVSMKEGERSSITCASHGDPVPNMTIQKVGSSEIFEISSPNDSVIFFYIYIDIAALGQNVFIN